ncbi:oxygenase MpaB family protein, partial [Nocardioides massiliensis]
GQRLLRMHAQIKGVDAAGRRYHALDPDAYAWVHATAYEGTRLFLLEAGPGLTDAQDEQLFTEWRRLGLLIGVRDSALPRTRAEFWELWDRTLPQLENNPVVQDLLWSAPTAPPYVPQKLVDLASAPVLRRQREVMAVTLDPALRARIGLPEPTDRVRRRVQRTMRLMRLGNGLPERVRHNPLTWRTAARTAADPRLGPEPVRYP